MSRTGSTPVTSSRWILSQISRTPTRRKGNSSVDYMAKAAEHPDIAGRAFSDSYAAAQIAIADRYIVLAAVERGVPAALGKPLETA